MLRKLIATFMIFSCVVAFAAAQGVNATKALHSDNGYFNHLDVSASMGSTGIGIDVAAPVGEYAKLRVGFSYMPRIELNSLFRVQVGDSLEHKFDKNGNRVETKFDKLSGMLYKMYGYKVDDEVEMKIKPTYYNARFLVDVTPFQNKSWRFTAGFYVGNKTIGRAYNSTEDMPTLMAVNMYNEMYRRLREGEPLFNLGDPFSFDLPPYVEEPLLEKFDEYGKMAVPLGYYVKDGPMISVPDGGYDENGEKTYVSVPAYRKGDPYMLVPDAESGMVRVKAKARNTFRPYVGFGYSGVLSKDGRTEFVVDAGVLFWGGKPHVYTHDGTDLVYDVKRIQGKVGSYVKAIKAFPVFPVLELRVTRRIL